MGRHRYIWGAAAAAVAGLSATLLLQGAGGQPTAGAASDGKPVPVKAHARTAALESADGGRRAVLKQQNTAPFSMLGITWTDPSAQVTGTIEARTRFVGSGQWSDWLRLDGDSGPGESVARRGGTEPAWVGPSDGVEARVTVGGKTSATLPAGLRLDMIDPGKSTQLAIEPAAFRADATQDLPRRRRRGRERATIHGHPREQRSHRRRDHHGTHRA